VRDLHTGVTTRENLDEHGNPTPGETVDGRISADGRYVAFLSAGKTLAPARYRACDGADTVGRLVGGDCYNVFLRDRWQGTTRIVSVGASGMRTPQPTGWTCPTTDASSPGRRLAPGCT
jgi:hypothetical protein